MRIGTVVMIAFLSAATAAAAEWSVGAEGNDARGHVWVVVEQPVTTMAGGTVSAWATGSYLFYEVRDIGGTTSVRAPGVGGGVSWRWSNRDTTFGIGPGWDIRWVNREGAPRETLSGPMLRGDLVHRFGDATILTADGSWFDSIDWVATRGSVEQRFGDGLWIGPEAAYHGNDDVTITEVGGIARQNIGGRTSLVIRGGSAEVRHRSGETERRPYYSVGIARSF